MVTIFFPVLLACVLGLVSVAISPSQAAELQKTRLSMAGLSTTQNMNKYILAPYFTKEITEKSKGAIVVDYKTSDELSLSGTEILRLMKMGVFDLGSGAISYFAGDDPRYEGMDLPGLTLDIETTRKVAQAYFSLVAQRLTANYNIKLFGLSPIAVQVWYCKPKIQSLDDLKGKKVRVFNRSMADFVEAVGAGTVNIPFTEVVPAMNRGVADCALTGTSAGNTARWWEVTSYLYMMPMGWAMQFYGINLNSWNKLAPQNQQFLLQEFKLLDDKMWAQAAADVQDGINCNTGQGPCKDGIEAKPKMTVVPVTEVDKALHRKIVEGTVVARWAKRCGQECAKAWNETIGKVVGMTAPLN